MIPRLFWPTDKLETRKIFYTTDKNPRVRLIVFESDVVFRAMFFDQVIFKYIGLCFRVSDHEVEVMNMGHKKVCF